MHIHEILKVWYTSLSVLQFSDQYVNISLSIKKVIFNRFNHTIVIQSITDTAGKCQEKEPMPKLPKDTQTTVQVGLLTTITVFLLSLFNR